MFVRKVSPKSAKDIQKQIKQNLKLDKIERASDSNDSNHKGKSVQSVQHGIITRLYSDLAKRRKTTEK